MNCIWFVKKRLWQRSRFLARAALAFALGCSLLIALTSRSEYGYESGSVFELSISRCFCRYTVYWPQGECANAAGASNKLVRKDRLLIIHGRGAAAPATLPLVMPILIEDIEIQYSCDDIVGNVNHLPDSQVYRD